MTNKTKFLLRYCAVFALAAILFIAVSVHAAGTVLFPIGGGLGTSTPPAYGQVPVGNTGGTYTLTATSSLGISGGGTSISGTQGQDVYIGPSGSAIATSSIFLLPNGNVGISTTTPNANLVVNGTTGQALFQIATSTNQNILTVSANGYVGIGAGNSAVPLQVGTKISNFNIFSLTNTNNGNTYANVFADSSSNAWLTLNDSANTTQVRFSTNAGIPSYINNTNFGVGTTSPSDLLSVSGNAYFATNVGIGTNAPRGSLDVSAVGPTSFFLGNGAIGDNQLIVLNGGRGTIGYDGLFQGTEVNGSSKPVEITTGSALGTGQVAYFGTNGNVGIGSSTPYARLSVVVGNDYLAHPVSAAVAIGSSSAGTATTTIFGVDSTGNVTIPLTGAGSASSGAGYRFAGTCSGFSGLSATDIRFAVCGANDPLRLTNTNVFLNSNVSVGTISVGGPTNGLYVLGNTGLGTTTPAAGNQLAVQGNTYLSGNLFVGGAITATSTLTLSALGTPAGAFLAVSPTGQVIATTTPSGGSGVTSVTGTYPVISSGGLAPAISLAFGTTTANSWSGLQQFNGGASTTNFTNTGSEWLTSLANPAGSFIAVSPTGQIIATTTPTGSNSAFSPAANYATTGVLAGYTYTAGVITEVGTGALSVDGANPTVGQTVLVKNESGACTSSSGGCNNGLYNVTAAGSGIAAFVLTRNSNYNSSSNVIPGIVTYVISGTVNADDFWAMTSAAPITIGTTALTYAEVSGGGASVTSVSNSDSSLTISPTAGAVVASINTAHANNWSGLQSFAVSSTSVASHTGTTYLGATATTTINADGNGSIVVPSAGSITDTGLGTPAGTFLAAGPTGLIIATTSPSGGITAASNIQVFTATTSTWTMPAGTKTVQVFAIGCGGGGGGGGISSGGTGSGGGAGGNGAIVQGVFRASDITSPVTVTTCATGSGNGGAGVSGTNGNGSPGSSGSSVTFGTYLTATGGTAGLGGSQSGSATGANSVTPASMGYSLGAGGGAKNNSSGGSGGTSPFGFAGGSDGNPGQAGASCTVGIWCEGGNGGGGDSVSGSGKAGGSGGLYGGGGGGGASGTTGTSGQGGPGGLGIAVVVAYF